MTVLSVIIPSFNSQHYMSNCVNSIIDSGENIEILIVNDGSTDETGHVANDFEQKYPDRIKAIHQTNLGHGGAVNTGISHASGKYIKVVDSDDWVNSEALRTVVGQLKSFIENDQKVDMMLSDFIYDKVGENNKTVMQYKGIIPDERIISWDEVGRFKAGKYILMHSVIYSRETLMKSGLKLPEHTFYVDNLFVYQPLPFVESIYYMNLCVYHYFIGRDDQSVNENNMMRRIDQQLLVNHIMLKSTNLKSVKGYYRQKYMMHYLTIITTISSVLLLKIGTDDAISKKNALWKSIKHYDLQLYLRMRMTLVGGIINLPGITGRKVSLFVYNIARKRVGFN